MLFKRRLNPLSASLCVLSIGWSLATSILYSQETASLSKNLEKREKESREGQLTALDSLSKMTPGDDLAIDLVAAEPTVEQPSFMRFDERGRLWVVQYRQYPNPAGLEIQSRDTYWRNRYNKTPPPPGDLEYTPGKDKITIFEDANSDGTFEPSKTFLDGLSLCTSFAFDRNGLWVLQPPYLLFYRDEDRNDVPDGPPEIHLSGFGIEDSHSIANSLAWGPDGWLYGAQGSTVAASIEIAGSDAPPRKSVGQLMWRYHPEDRRYEVFSEGGGNIWSCQFDAVGRLYAGANEGGKLGYHYMQGAYNKKNFSKHGELSNPYAYDYFMGIQETHSQRVTTNLMVYEERALPDRYFGSIITANPLASRVLASRKISIGPTFHAEPIDLLIDSDDRWFRPVYAETGPDGAIYVADWYDLQVNHMENHEGRISVRDGRLYRIRPKNGYQPNSIDLGKLPTAQLVNFLQDDRRWFRSTARRLLTERQDRSISSQLVDWLEQETGQIALESLWMLNLLDELGPSQRQTALAHPNPFVRKWAIRLIGDARAATDREYAILAEIAQSDENIEVRQQLASTAKRLQSPEGLTIIDALMRRSEDAKDRYMPSLIWWALESHISSDRDRVMNLFSNPSLFNQAIPLHSLLQRTMRRIASDGSRAALRDCARLLERADSTTSREQLLIGFEAAYRGRSMSGLPEELLTALANAGGGSLALQLRQQAPESIVRAQAVLTNPSANAIQLRRIIETLGESPQPKLLGTLLEELERYDEETQLATLTTLRAYGDQRIGIQVTNLYPSFSDTQRLAAEALLMSRTQWTERWLAAIDRGQIDKDLVSPASIAALQQLEMNSIRPAIDRIWSPSAHPTSDDDAQMEAIGSIIAGSMSSPDPYHGRDLYTQRCAACHSLHDEGGNIGPELTGYQRHDLQSLLTAIVKPNAEIREGFENYLLETKDGQHLSGFVVDQDPRVIVIRTLSGQSATIEKSNLRRMSAAEFSLMPPGLLSDLDEQSLIDLFAYLQSSQPLFKRRN